MNFTEEKTIKVGETKVINYLPKEGVNSVREEIVIGLKSKQKVISSKYFYDERGSLLFEEITQLEEYYPSRCEKEILSTIVNKLDINFYELDIIELGSGDSSKIKTIFCQIPPNILASINYYPVDISQSAIENSVQNILEEFDLNNITGIVADFLHHHNYMPRRNKRLFCFLGGTIGNLSTSEVENFTNELGKVMNEGDSLLLGVDMVKNNAIIESAYNDKKGITAYFNKNILNVINGHIQSNFNTLDFEHLAFYNSNKQRIEMHLVAKKDLNIAIAYSNEVIQIKKGETIHTENSCKYTPNGLEEIGNYGDMRIERVITDSKGWFSLAYFRK